MSNYKILFQGDSITDSGRMIDSTAGYPKHGLVTLIAVQTILNLGVVTNLLPSTGIALPFFSYGGTALAVNLGEMGIVLSVSRYRNATSQQEELL